MTHLETEGGTTRRRGLRAAETNAQYTVRWLAICALIGTVAVGFLTLTRSGDGTVLVPAGIVAFAVLAVTYAVMDVVQRVRNRRG